MEVLERIVHLPEMLVVQGVFVNSGKHMPLAPFLPLDQKAGFVRGNGPGPHFSGQGSLSQPHWAKAVRPSQ